MNIESKSLMALDLSLFQDLFNSGVSGRFFLGTFGLLYLIKAIILLASRLQERKVSFSCKLLFMSIWPGMDPQAMSDHRNQKEDIGRYFVEGYLTMLVGFFLMLALALSASLVPAELLGLLGIIPFILMLHFGLSKIINAVFWLCGLPVPMLFKRPLESRSLRDFWSNRWNCSFVEMNRVLFQPLLRKLLPGKPRMSFVGVFLLSGLLHEVGISFPAGGWGLPLCYFALQAALIFLESSIKMPAGLRKLYVYASVILPFPILFHSQFRKVVVLPSYTHLEGFLLSFSVEQYFWLALWVAAIGHGIVLCAGIQLPFRLNWREDLKSIKAFNRKILWNYGVFIFMLVIGFGALTAILHEEMLAGDKAALCLCAMIGIFWTMRILADTFYFDHSDWPEGPQFVIGHTLLNTAFFGMSGTYLGLVAWHWLA